MLHLETEFWRRTQGRQGKRLGRAPDCGEVEGDGAGGCSLTDARRGGRVVDVFRRELVHARALAVRGSGRVWPSCGPSRSARTSTCSRRTCLHFAPLISRAKKKAGQIGSGRRLLDSVRPLWVARLQRALDAVGPRRASSALPQASLRSDLEIIAMAAQVSGCHRFRCQDHFLHVLRHMVPLFKY